MGQKSTRAIDDIYHTGQAFNIIPFRHNKVFFKCSFDNQHVHNLQNNEQLGTRIIYDRNTLLSLRNSPLSRTPPAKLAFVAGVTGASLPHQAGSIHNRSHLNVETHDSGSDDDSDEDSDDEKRKAVAKAQEEEDAKGKLKKGFSW